MEEWRKWEELDTNILEKIFGSISVYDRITKVCLVCRSWKSVSLDSVFWGQTNLQLDLTPCIDVLKRVESAHWSFVFENIAELHWYYERLSVTLMKILHRILMDGQDAFGFPLEHWRLSVKTIFIPKKLAIWDRHLSYLAERTPNVESLVLICTSTKLMITSGGFGKAVSSWKKMKHIRFEFSGANEKSFAEILREICRNCSQLVTLHVNCRLLFLGADITQGIATNLPRLETLKLERAKLFTSGMNILLSNFRNLQAIYFCDCNFMEFNNGGYPCISKPSVSFVIKFGEQQKRNWSFQAAGGNSDLQNQFEMWMQGLTLPLMQGYLMLADEEEDDLLKHIGC